MSAVSIEIYRSPRKALCDERALVLLALGIPSTVRIDHGQFILEVDAAQFEQALGELRHYELESRPVAVTPSVRSTPYPHAWVGCVVYVAVLLAVSYSISAGLFRLDAFDLGDLDAARVQSGEWWRAWTSLTLHLDAAHLAANLGAGVWFGYLAASELGSGSAWFLIVSGAAFANWLEGELGPATHRAVGASTAVFAALGMLAAHSWRMRLHLPQRWALRWAPLVAGIVLLAWLGTAGDGTDVVAHVIGFMVGTLLGAAAAVPSVSGALRRIPQGFGGLAALASLALAWSCALLS